MRGIGVVALSYSKSSLRFDQTQAIVEFGTILTRTLSPSEFPSFESPEAIMDINSRPGGGGYPGQKC